jgi:hypothetical protein
MRNLEKNSAMPVFIPASVIQLEHIERDLQEKKRELEQDEDEINDYTDIGEIVPVINIRDSVFAVKGDISIIGGQPKVGKTSVCAFILATALMKDVEGLDTLGIRSTFCEGKKVIYIDTEQPKAYTNRLRKSVLRILELHAQPENLKIYNLRKYDSEKKLEKVLKLMEQYPDAHLWIIDGVADLIRDPNDTKESFGIIEKFMMKSDQLNTAIVLHIHENPGGSGKLRGNLGSEAERKCGGAIAIKKIKERGIHSIEAKVIRGSEDFEPVLFRFDKVLGRMASIDQAESEQLLKSLDKTAMKLEKRIQMAKRCVMTGSLKWSDLVNKILSLAVEIEGKPISGRTAENRVKEMIDNGILIIKDEFYRLSDKYIQQP